jgi:hypothetical protein
MFVDTAGRLIGSTCRGGVSLGSFLMGGLLTEVGSVSFSCSKHGFD